MTIDFLISQFAYDTWATNQLVNALAPHPAVHDAALKNINHLIAARQVWLDRFHCGSSDLTEWPDWDLDTSKLQLRKSHLDWGIFLDDLDSLDFRLDDKISYRLKNGKELENALQDIICFLLMNSMFFRGQVAQILAYEDIHVPDIDYMTYRSTVS